MEVNAKFDIGDQVWLVSANKVITVFVTGLVILLEGDTLDVKYATWSNDNIPENLLFKTKKELLESL